LRVSTPSADGGLTSSSNASVMKDNRAFVVGLALAASTGGGLAARAVAVSAHDAAGNQRVGSGSRPAPDSADVTAQIKRGEATYLDECARCHSDTLSGTEFGPAVVGGEFVRNWTGKSAGEMFARVRDTMPVDGPGRLTAQQSADLVAFILRKNDVDVGAQPLAPEAAALKSIIISISPVR
jgi:mono/diheme cytochrome c family protein